MKVFFILRIFVWWNFVIGVDCEYGIKFWLFLKLYFEFDWKRGGEEYVFKNIEVDMFCKENFCEDWLEFLESDFSEKLDFVWWFFVKDFFCCNKIFCDFFVIFIVKFIFLVLLLKRLVEVL